MNEIGNLLNIIEKIIPAVIRKSIYRLFLGDIVFFLKHFNIYMKSLYVLSFKYFLPKSELNIIYAFIGKYGLSALPYSFRLKYEKMQLEAYYDKAKQLPYVFHNEKKLYFPSSFSLELTVDCYRALVTEQDLESAHRYVNSYDELTDMILLDIGAAEGIFSLNTIDYTKHVYLFECDERWIEALCATFEPWERKVTIEKLYVGNKTELSYITIDDFVKDKALDNVFMKMDIEGAEQDALSSACETLKTLKYLYIS